jgi:AraC family transcriptional activator of tynA and feaB
VEILFSTLNVHPRDRFDSWHSVACRNLVEHDSNPDCRHKFHAELRYGALAEIGLVLFESSAMTVAHTVRHVALASADELFVCRQISGRLGLEQDSREVQLEPGDITLLDPRLPYVGRFSAGSGLLVLKVPRRLLESRVGRTRELTARSIKPVGADGGLISTFLAMLPTHAAGLSAAVQEIVQDQVLDLVAVPLAKATGDSRPRASAARALVRMSVSAAITARLADPAVDAGTIASAAGVSVRYANAVLAESGTSIMRLIQSRRLARCRQLLEDPSQSHRTMTEIAYSWGFSDMTHFGRKFRAAFGSLPSEHRKRCRTHRG